MKQKIVILTFFISLTVLSIYSYIYNSSRPMGKDIKRDSQKQNSQSFFKEINYFVSTDAVPNLRLKAKELIIDEMTKNLNLFAPIGVSFANGVESFNFEAELGNYLKLEGLLTLKKKAHLYKDDLDIKCELANYQVDPGKATCTENVRTRSYSIETKDKIFVTSDELESYPAKKLSYYRGNVSGKVTRKKKYEEPIEFKSDAAKVNLLTSLVNLNDNVWLKQGLITATSQRGEIYLENYNKKLKYFVLYDDVNVREVVHVQRPTGKSSFVRKALSEKLVGITSEEILVLTGFPKVYQFKDIIRGNRIILRRDSELLEVEDANTIFYLKQEEEKKKKKPGNKNI